MSAGLWRAMCEWCEVERYHGERGCLWCLEDENLKLTQGHLRPKRMWAWSAHPESWTSPAQAAWVKLVDRSYKRRVLREA